MHISSHCFICKYINFQRGLGVFFASQVCLKNVHLGVMSGCPINIIQWKDKAFWVRSGTRGSGQHSPWALSMSVAGDHRRAPGWYKWVPHRDRIPSSQQPDKDVQMPWKWYTVQFHCSWIWRYNFCLHYWPASPNACSCSVPDSAIYIGYSLDGSL